jgi:outer membrane lipoprotein-sorting protein
MMKKRLMKIVCVAVVALSVATACAQQQVPALAAPAPRTQSSPTPAPASTAEASPTPAATPAASTHQPSAAETAVAQFPPTNDAKEIVRRSMEIDRRTLDLARNYTCQQREVIKHLDKHGDVKSTEIKTYDVGFYYGEEYSRLIMVDDKPLSDKEKKKEDEKLEKFLAKLRNESPEERQKRSDKEKKERQESRAYRLDVANAYDFRIVGEEELEGVNTWVIEATPRKDFKPTQPHADMLKKIKGKMWIDKKEYNWIRVEAEATDTISFGLFLFRIHPGSRFNFQQMHLNDEVWLLRRVYVNGGARIALLKNEAIEQEDTFSNYKKFSSTFTILPGVKEVPPEEKQK